MRHIIWEEYNHLFPHNELLIGHIYHECPILTKDCGYSEERSRYGYNDYGYAFGLMQHNIHHRSAKWMKENDLYYRPSNPANCPGCLKAKKMGDDVECLLHYKIR